MTTEAIQALVKEGDLLVGKYRVERVLGIGGMGVVVAAMHVDLEQRVALKFLLPELAQNAEAVERFLREARAAVRLKSEHVAKVLDVGKLETGAPYIVMEFLDGSDLGSVVELKRPTLPEAIEYMLQTCEAIAEAHALGIVHRDLKPQNLFLTRRVHGAPLVKVLDFGISKAVTPGTVSNMTLTKTGIVMGSPLYMSPEQMKSGRLADHRSDLWALGIILYQLLTGALPFEAETVPHLCAMIMTENPRPLAEVCPGIPVGLQGVVTRALEKDPNKRFQNVGELAAAIEPFAPLAARGAVSRISNVLNVPTASLAPPEPTTSAPPPVAKPSQAAMTVVAPAQSQTSVNWSESNQTQIRRTAHQRMMIIGGVGAVAVVGILALVLARSGTTSSAAPDRASASSNGEVTPKSADSPAAPKPTTTSETEAKVAADPTTPPALPSATVAVGANTTAVKPSPTAPMTTKTPKTTGPKNPTAKPSESPKTPTSTAPPNGGDLFKD